MLISLMANQVSSVHSSDSVPLKNTQALKYAQCSIFPSFSHQQCNYCSRNSETWDVFPHMLIMTYINCHRPALEAQFCRNATTFSLWPSLVLCSPLQVWTKSSLTKSKWFEKDSSESRCPAPIIVPTYLQHTPLITKYKFPSKYISFIRHHSKHDV